MSGLNIHALANSIVRESASADPDVMADEFVARIDPDDYLMAQKWHDRADRYIKALSAPGPS